MERHIALCRNHRLKLSSRKLHASPSIKHGCAVPRQSNFLKRPHATAAPPFPIQPYPIFFNETASVSPCAKLSTSFGRSSSRQLARSSEPVCPQAREHCHEGHNINTVQVPKRSSPPQSIGKQMCSSVQPLQVQPSTCNPFGLHIWACIGARRRNREAATYPLKHWASRALSLCQGNVEDVLCNASLHTSANGVRNQF